MKKTRANAGLTLLEMLVTIVILVLLVIGIGVGMDSGSKIYRDATFESDSATLAGIVNTNLGDILRYSTNIRENPGTFEDAYGNYLPASQVGFVFTNLEYGIQDAYFYTPVQTGGVSQGVLQMKSLKGNTSNNNDYIELVNSGAYPDLVISNFKITYVVAGTNSDGGSGRGGYFNVSYDIFSTTSSTLHRQVETVIRLMND